MQSNRRYSKADSHPTAHVAGVIALTPVARGREYAGTCSCGWRGETHRLHLVAHCDAIDHAGSTECAHGVTGQNRCAQCAEGA